MKFSCRELNKIALGFTHKGIEINHLQQNGLKILLIDEEKEIIVDSDNADYVISQFIMNGNQVVGFKVKQVI